MAKNRESQKMIEPRLEYSDEDDSGEEDASSEDSESEPEETGSESELVSSSSSDETGSESESDLDEPVSQQKTIVVPVKSRSVEQVTPSAVVKRPAEEKEVENRDAKKAKKKVEDSPVKSSKEEQKKSFFKRLWSVLNGMIEYCSSKDQGGDNGVGSPKANGSVERAPVKKGASPSTNANSNSVENDEEVKDIHPDVCVSVKRRKLSPRNGPVVVTGMSIEDRIMRAGEEFFGGVTGMSIEDRIMRAGEEFFGGEVVEGEEWSNLKVEEVELHCRQLEAKLSQSKLVLGFLKSQDP